MAINHNLDKWVLTAVDDLNKKNLIATPKAILKRTLDILSENEEKSSLFDRETIKKWEEKNLKHKDNYQKILSRLKKAGYLAEDGRYGELAYLLTDKGKYY